jgi:thymidylate synthase
MEYPVITIKGKGIAEVWEKSLVALWEKGAENKTEYDKKSDPPSKDATMIMVVNDPFAEPRIHLAFPGGMEDLEKYKQEVVFGVHDHWINPEEGKWTYTYHARLFNYYLPENPKEIVHPVRSRSPLGDRTEMPKALPTSNGINQVEKLIEKLSATSYSRRAQAITWIPFCDANADDPPCLQRIWCRIIEDSGKLFLAMNTHWRSRDAYRAAFMNLFGITELQKYIAGEISKRINKKVEVGRYVDISDSYHIYGESFGDFENRFLNLLGKREFYNSEISKSRTVRSDDEVAVEGFEYGKKLLEMEKQTGKKGATS